MLKSEFEMKIQMRSGDYIVHTALVGILALSCLSIQQALLYCLQDTPLPPRQLVTY